MIAAAAKTRSWQGQPCDGLALPERTRVRANPTRAPRQSATAPLTLDSVYLSVALHAIWSPQHASAAMSTAQRRRGKSLHLELPGGSQDEKPPLAALFLIQFDIKAGSVPLNPFAPTDTDNEQIYYSMEAMRPWSYVTLFEPRTLRILMRRQSSFQTASSTNLCPRGYTM